MYKVFILITMLSIGGCSSSNKFDNSDYLYDEINSQIVDITYPLYALLEKSGDEYNLSTFTSKAPPYEQSKGEVWIMLHRGMSPYYSLETSHIKKREYIKALKSIFSNDIKISSHNKLILEYKNTQKNHAIEVRKLYDELRVDLPKKEKLLLNNAKIINNTPWFVEKDNLIKEISLLVGFSYFDVELEVDGTSLKDLNKNIRRKSRKILNENKKKGSRLNLYCPSDYIFNNKKFIIENNCDSITKEGDVINLTLADGKFDKKALQEVLPSSISVEDDNIAFSFNKKEFLLTNKTNDFIHIDNFSFYYNGNISSLTNLKVTIPPKSTNQLFTLRHLNLKKESIDFSNALKSKGYRKISKYDIFRSIGNSKYNVNLNYSWKELDNIKVNYGLALNYKLLNSNKTISLFENKKYQLIHLI